MSEASEQQVPDWAQEALPEALHDVAFLSGAETVEAFKDQINYAAAWRGNSIRTPGPDAGPEDIAAFRSKVIDKFPDLMLKPDSEDAEARNSILKSLDLLPPDSAEGYTLPDGVELDDETAALYRQEAFDMGLDQARFEKKVQSVVERGSEAQKQASEAHAADIEGLKSEWGHAFSDRMGEIGAFLDASSDVPKEIAEAFNANSLNSTTLKWLHGLSALGDEHGQSAKQGDGGERALTPDEIQAQIGELTAQIYDPENAEHPRRKQWVQKRRKLIEQLNPEG